MIKNEEKYLTTLKKLQEKEIKVIEGFFEFTKNDSYENLQSLNSELEGWKELVLEIVKEQSEIKDHLKGTPFYGLSSQMFNYVRKFSLKEKGCNGD